MDLFITQSRADDITYVTRLKNAVGVMSGVLEFVS